MQRDLDLLRRILERVEAEGLASEEPVCVYDLDPDEDKVIYHVNMAYKIGYISIKNASSVEKPHKNFPTTLTFSGHNHLDEVRLKD